MIAMEPSQQLRQLVGDLTDAERVLIQALRDIGYGQLILDIHASQPIAWRRVQRKVRIRIEKELT